MSQDRAAARVSFGNPAAFRFSLQPAGQGLARRRGVGLRFTPPGAATLLVLACAVAALAAAAVDPGLFNDGDTWWHLATGDWMIRHRAVLHADPFSYTAPGHPWVTHEWLSELLMAPVQKALGWAGLQLMFALAVAALAGVMGAELRRKLPTISWVAALVMALACTTQSWLARPHLLALPILAVWTVQLIRAREQDRLPPLWLLPMMTVWANLHGSFLFGLGLLAPFGLEAVIEAKTDRVRVARGWALFMGAALLAALLTPHGIDGLLYPIKISSMKTLQNIKEWRSADFGSLGPLELSLVVALYALLSRGVRIPPIRLLMVLGLLHLALHEMRHEMVFAVVGVLLLAEPLGKALRPEGPPPARKLSARAQGFALAGIAAAALGVCAGRLLIPVTRIDGPTSPISALAHVPAALAAKPVLNEYGMGGYLIYKGVKPFIDGRSDMYGDAFFDAYSKAVQPDRAKLVALLARRHVAWTILDANNAAVQVLDGLPGWKRLYADRYAVVHVRTGA